VVKTLKLTSYCAIISFGLWLVGAIWADSRGQGGDPVLEIDVTVQFDAPDCIPRESAPAAQGLTPGYYRDCYGITGGDSGGCGNTSKPAGALLTQKFGQ